MLFVGPVLGSKVFVPTPSNVAVNTVLDLFEYLFFDDLARLATAKSV